MQDLVRAAMKTPQLFHPALACPPASAVRLARRFGSSGYPGIRSHFQANLIDGGGDFDNPGTGMAARLARAESGGLLDSALGGEIAALQILRNKVCAAEVGAFSESIRDCHRLSMFDRGPAASLSSLIALRLDHSAYVAVDLGSQLHQFAEALARSSEDDVVWLLASRKASPLIHEVGAIAANKRVRTLALTYLHAARVHPAPDHQISVSQGEAGEAQSLLVPMIISNAVILDLAAIDDGPSLRALQAFKTLRMTCGLSKTLL